MVRSIKKGGVMARTVKEIPKNSGSSGRPRVSRQVTIASGETTSTDEYVSGEVLVGIVMPAEWTAANLTFEVSHDWGETWHPVYTQTGVQVKVSGLVTNAFHSVPTVPLMGISNIRLVASTAQEDDRTLTLILMQ